MVGVEGNEVIYTMEKIICCGVLYCLFVLDSIKVNVGRNVTCAVHAAQWV